MEQNLVITKTLLSIVRVVYFMLRKGISKSKLALLDLNVMMKRGKLAGKAIGHLIMFHHHHGGSASNAGRAASRSHKLQPSFVGATEYEFSCSNSPAFPAFHIGKRRHLFGRCAYPPYTLEDDVAAANTVKTVLELLNKEVAAVEASPLIVLPGFGRSPMVRQLRITDSPFPLREADEECHVDKAAEEFINRFYKELKLQK